MMMAINQVPITQTIICRVENRINKEYLCAGGSYKKNMQFCNVRALKNSALEKQVAGDDIKLNWSRYSH